MATYKAIDRVALGGKVVEAGEQFEADDGPDLRRLASHGVVEQVEQEAKPKAPPRAKRRNRS